MNLEYHPLANLFPLIEGDDFADLVADVAAHGIQQPIDLYQGKILDGRNRYRAARAAEVEIGPQHVRYFREELFGDPLAYVISQNLQRRHLDDRQRASIAGKIANMTRGRPAGPEPENPPIGGFSAAQAAAKLNVSERQVERARVVHDQGVPELCEALDRGEIPVSAAERLARKDVGEQRAELAQLLPRGARAVMAARIEPDDSLDFFPTPPWATRALMEVVLPHLGVRQVRQVWEPACGEGHIAEVLREYVPDVVATDIRDYGYRSTGVADFLADIVPGADDGWIVTNPPFGSRTIPFVLRALDFVPRGGVAMFLRSQWAVEGIERWERVFRDRCPTLCAYFVERVPLCKGRWDPDGSTATAYCWLVWVAGGSPLPPLWIPPGQCATRTRPDDAEHFTRHPVARRSISLDGPVDLTTGEIIEPEGERGGAVSAGGSAGADGGARQATAAGVMPAGEAPSAGPEAVVRGATVSGLLDRSATDDGLDIPDFLRRSVSSEPVGGGR
ncbi:hypothetical protein A33M_1721 [Rhodovulum sp. PH10]|uniref:SAM-dependent methyltransferase n=1 Tax=Rhodovulum sp. PH10 TaxID=1187851 RepID=UPI00027C24BD|nr:SAM-dependent methyltransferase [Rhodovulum sp. PH10]EJW12751.1 hypothetical protein A33M_1721 [Rhodovulum sp. PH10]